ncbi:MAG: ThuA domain-containing protein, partial [Verrucomicrobia bacterium]|nr:ThuA domain-containing protein [Verrucomicrobiota bacterium]
GAKDARYVPGQLELLGGTRGGPQRKYKELETDLTVADPAHPVVAGLEHFRIFDEFYYHLDLVQPSPRFHILLTARIDGRDEPVCWAWDRPDGGRSFGFVGIHFHRNWRRAEYRRLVVQGILWSLKFPVPQGGVDVNLDPRFLELKPPARSPHQGPPRPG